MSADVQQEGNYGIALYHPNIHIRDVDWLKSALLYWNAVRRIVPDRFPADEEDEKREAVLQVIKAGKEAGRELLIRTPPTEYLEDAAMRFIDRVIQLNHSSSAVNAQPTPLNMLVHRVTTAYRRLTGTEEVTDRGLHALLENLKREDDGGDWVDMWSGKMTDQLKRLLGRAGLLHVDEDTNLVWVQKAAATLYMTSLAIVMKERIRAPLVTDFEEYEDAGKFLDYGQPKQEPDRVELLLDLKIPFPSPKALHEVPMSKVLEFHFENERLRSRFRDAVEKIVVKAGKAQGDQYRYEDFLSQESEEVKDAIEAHRDKMKTIGVKGVGSILRISAPTALTSLPAAAAAVAMTINPVTLGALAGAGVGLSLVAWWAEVRGQRRDEIRNCPWHYLLPLERQFPLPAP